MNHRITSKLPYKLSNGMLSIEQSKRTYRLSTYETIDVLLGLHIAIPILDCFN